MPKKSRTTYSVINISVSIFGYILNTFMGFICRMVFVRCLPPEYLGISGLLSNVLSMLSLAELGIGTAIVYALYKPLAENDTEKIASIMKFYSTAYRVIGIVVAIIGISLIPFLDFIIGDTSAIEENFYIIYGIYLFSTCLTYFFSYRSSLFVAAQRNYVQSVLSYMITTVQSVLQIVYLFIFKEYLGYLIIQAMGTFAFNIIVSHWAKKEYPYISDKNIKPLPKKEKRSLVNNIKALTVNKISTMLVNGTDNLIITYFRGLIAVGTVSNYTLLSSTLSAITHQVFGGLTASVGNLNAIENEEKRYGFFKILQMATFFVYGWATIGMMFVSSDLVGLLFGEQFIVDDNIPFVLAINFYIVNMLNPIDTYRSTLGLFKYGQYTLLITAILNIVFSIWLGNIWGVFGIFFATTIARILTNVWYMPYAIFKHGFKRSPWDYFKSYFMYTFIIIAEILLCYIICRFINFSCLVNTILKFVICSIIPIGIFCLCFHRTAEFKYLKNKFFELKNKFKTKIFKHKPKKGV